MNVPSSLRPDPFPCAYLYSPEQDFESPSNDECSNAVLIDSVPAVIQGDTTGALSGASYTKGYSTYSVARAVWYKFIGHGKIIQLSLRDADFDVRLVVYKGGNCTSFELADNLLLEEKDTKATWAGDDGVEYIVMVGGETIGDIGPFNLNIEVSTGVFHSMSPTTLRFALSLIHAFAVLCLSNQRNLSAL